MLDSNASFAILVALLVAGSFWFGQRAHAVAAGCRTVPLPIDFAPELIVAMAVKAGASCAIRSGVANNFVEALDVEIAPEHGMLRLRARSGISYHPAQGYIGHDTFAFVRRESAQRMNRKSLVHVEVSVE